MTAAVLVRHLTPSGTVGLDGIPDYVTALKGDPRRWVPEPGYRLEVRCNGTLLRYVIEADRAKGWVLTKKMIDHGDGEFTAIPGKEMCVQGVVTFTLVRADARFYQ